MKPRVLLAEDEMLIALDARDALTGRGYEVLGPAARVETALALAHEPLDAAVLDVNLDGERVWPAAELLMDRGVPFVLLTGFGAALEVPERLHAAPRFSKPVEHDRLIDALDALVCR